jgi:Uma2 family endonuclease
MKLAMATEAVAISMEEYLRTSYEYDAEWVDGAVVERALPNYSHTRAERWIVHRLADTQAQAKLFASPNLRVRVAERCWRIPDISIFADREPDEAYPSNLFAAIEILSPGDAMAEVYDKLSEYAAMGIPHIFVVDPAHRLLLKYESRSLIDVTAIEFPERGFRMTVDEIFA